MSGSLFTVHSYTIEVKELNKPIYLIPFGDIHRFAPLCNVDHWKAFLDWARSKERCYFIGMGDYDDLASFSERRVLSSLDLHESTKQSLDDYYAERTKKLIDELAFMKGRIIGLVEGNHYSTFGSNSKIDGPINFVDGTTTTQMMCQYLQTKYLGVNAFIRLSMPYEKGKKACVDLWVHHGRGSSRLTGSSLNTVQQMMDCADADIYLMGHDHKKSIATKSRLYLGDGTMPMLHHKKILLGRTGSFLKGYEPECESYVALAGLSPTDMGVLKLELTPKRCQRGGRDIYYIDLHGSI